MYRAMEADIKSQKFDGDGVGLMFDIREAMIDFVVKKIRLLNPNKFSIWFFSFLQYVSIN